MYTPRLHFIGIQQAGATANHLPKLCIGIDRLGEDQINQFRHVYAGIQHIHANGDSGHIIMLELVKQTIFAIYAGIV